MKICCFSPAMRPAWRLPHWPASFFLPYPLQPRSGCRPRSIPTHYTLTLTPDLKAATFSGVESIDVSLKEPTRSITLNALDIVPVRNHLPQRPQQTGTVSLDPEKEQATFTFPATVPAGNATCQDPLHRYPEQQAARLLSRQNRPPQLRRHAVRIHRRPPRLSLLRRAGLQGHITTFRW